MNRGYCAGKKLRSWWIGTRQVRVVQVTGFCGMQFLNGRSDGNNHVRVVAEPLQVAVLDIAVNIIIGPSRQPKKLNVPHRRQDEPDDDDVSRKSWLSEEFTNR